VTICAAFQFHRAIAILVSRSAARVRSSGIWNADAVGNGAESRKGPATVCSEEIFRHAVDGRAAAYLGVGCRW
jgi:hypothetical protein